MPRLRKVGRTEPKRRSRKGCWQCKSKKIKCDEEHPVCINCRRTGDQCDYSIRLNWGGRRRLRADSDASSPGPTGGPGLAQFQTYALSNQAPGAQAMRPGSSYQVHGDGSRTDQDGSSIGVAERSKSSSCERVSSENSTTYAPQQPASTGPADDMAQHSVLHVNQAWGFLPLPSMSASGPTKDETRLTSHGSPDMSCCQDSEVPRLSVGSLLSSPVDASSRIKLPLIESRSYRTSESTCYGVDRGVRDPDIGLNDDGRFAFETFHDVAYAQESVAADVAPNEGDPPEFGFGLETGCANYGTGGYYDRSVVIWIPRILEPLPLKLRENPMNLLYFHHFINHTARVLVPHDDPSSNPFRVTLPGMAVKHDHLLSLLLAYSACHRARLLQHPEPATRIALWVQDIFPALREALDDPQQIVSNANLATAIMLASLDIISPRAFGYDIPWQKHLSLARNLVKARPGGLRRTPSTSQEDQVCSFLWSWFAYLDVLGSLSGGPTDPSSTWILNGEMDSDEENDEIDCIMGFTTRCVYILAKIAELAKACDAQRIKHDNRVDHSWAPSPELINSAQVLQASLYKSLSHPSKTCRHLHANGHAHLDKQEMAATNEAYHWAGLVHLHRRVLGKPSDDEDVRHAVMRIFDCLDSISRGGTAETCLLFPMFTAGCESSEEDRRMLVLARILTVESSGMTQVHRARRLMQKVWDTGQPWETLLSTEFIG